MLGNDLVKNTAKLVGLYDQENQSVLTNKYLSAADLLEYINLRYQQDAAPALKRNYPTFFEKTHIVDNYEASVVVDALTSGSTINITTTKFTPNMVGAVLYNPDLGESRTIVSVTDNNTVVVDEAVNDTWDGDTIYVLSGRVNFSAIVSGTGAPAPASIIEGLETLYFGIKTTATQPQFYRVDIDNFNSINNNEFEDTTAYSGSSPRAWLSTEKDASGVNYSALNFRPLPTMNIDDSLYLKMTVMAPAVTLTTHPWLPSDSQYFLVYGAAADAGLALRLDKGDIDRFENKYQQGKLAMLSAYKPRQSIQMKPPRNRYDSNNRARRQRQLDTELIR